MDIGGGLAGPLVGMLLADQGADVIHIDPPGHGQPDHALDAVVNRGKRRATLDLKTDAGRAALLHRAAEADVVIENFAPETRAKLGLGEAALRAHNPKLIVVSLPGFANEDAATQRLAAHEGVIAALTGQYTDIHPVRRLFGLDPLYTALPLASVYAGVHAATAAVLALRQRRSTGRGYHLQAPLAGAAMTAMSSIHMHIPEQPPRYQAPRLPGLLKHAVLPPLRRWVRGGGADRQEKALNIARKAYPALMTSYSCADDRLLYLFAIDNAKLAERLLNHLELRERAAALGLVFADPYAGDRRDNLAEASNLSRRAQGRLKALLTQALQAKPAADWEAELSAIGITCAVQRTTDEWLALPALEQAGIVVGLDDPAFGPMRQPGVQVMLDATPTTMTEPVPRALAGEEPVDALPEWGKLPEGASQNRQRTDASEVPFLAGLKVLDLTSMVAGPVAARTLAEYGAEVTKIVPTHPNHGPRLTCWYAVDVDQGKRSVLLDLKQPAGRQAFDALLGAADVLVTNHMPRAMTALGLDEAALRRTYPRLIITRIGAYNGPRPGPWSDRPGYDPVVQAAAGIMRRYGDPEHPELHAIASCVDALTGYSAALGTALALLHRTRSGQGATVQTSLAAAATLVQLPYAFDYAGMQRDEPSGQHAKGESAFYRLYGARDGWLFLAAPKLDPAGLPPALAPSNTPGNDAAWAEHLARRIGQWSVARWLSDLSDAGITAVPVRAVADLRKTLGDAADAASRRLIRRAVPGLGDITTVPPLQVQIDGRPLPPLSPAEAPGHSTEHVLRGAGLDADALLEAGTARCGLHEHFLPD